MYGRLSDAESEATDPQSRVLLEIAYTALQPASLTRQNLATARTAVYIGCMYQEYTQLQYNSGHRITPAIALGSGISYLVGRVSYTFGLMGPCISTDTACSSSLVAMHLAHKVGTKFSVYGGNIWNHNCQGKQRRVPK